jgi:hypothetical protein
MGQKENGSVKAYASLKLYARFCILALAYVIDEPLDFFRRWIVLMYGKKGLRKLDLSFVPSNVLLTRGVCGTIAARH